MRKSARVVVAFLLVALFVVVEEAYGNVGVIIEIYVNEDFTEIKTVSIDPVSMRPIALSKKNFSMDKGAAILYAGDGRDFVALFTPDALARFLYRNQIALNKIPPALKPDEKAIYLFLFIWENNSQSGIAIRIGLKPFAGGWIGGFNLK